MSLREERSCFKCEKLFSELFRCKYDERGNWVFLCKKCLEESKLNNLFYQYGGTWKSKKKYRNIKIMCGRYVLYSKPEI